MTLKNKKFETLVLTIHDGGVFQVTLSRAEVRNALNTLMAIELGQVFEELKSLSEIRAVILTGSENKAFCAGADLKERNSMNMSEWKAQHLHFEKVIEEINSSKIPVIAAVNGVAFGGGLEIALACDFAVSVRASKFSFSEAKLGIIPGLGGIYRLTKLVGPARAKELVCSAKVFSSEDALEWGIFNRLVDSDSLIEEVLTIAADISACAPFAVSAAKEAVELSSSISLEDWTKEEHRLYYSLVESEERLSRIKSFNKK